MGRAATRLIEGPPSWRRCCRWRSPSSCCSGCGGGAVEVRPGEDVARSPGDRHLVAAPSRVTVRLSALMPPSSCSWPRCRHHHASSRSPGRCPIARVDAGGAEVGRPGLRPVRGRPVRERLAEGVRARSRRLSRVGADRRPPGPRLVTKKLIVESTPPSAPTQVPALPPTPEPPPTQRRRRSAASARSAAGTCPPLWCPLRLRCPPPPPAPAPPRLCPASGARPPRLPRPAPPLAHARAAADARPASGTPPPPARVTRLHLRLPPPLVPALPHRQDHHRQGTGEESPHPAEPTPGRVADDHLPTPPPPCHRRELLIGALERARFAPSRPLP